MDRKLVIKEQLFDVKELIATALNLLRLYPKDVYLVFQLNQVRELRKELRRELLKEPDNGNPNTDM